MPDRQEIVANSEPGQSKSGNTEVEGDTKETSQELPPPAARILKETEKLLQKGIALYKVQKAGDLIGFFPDQTMRNSGHTISAPRCRE